MPLIPEIGRSKPKLKLLIIGISAFLWLGIFIHLFPVWWTFTTSIKPVREIYKFPPTLWPKQPFWGTYLLFFKLSQGGWEALKYPIYVYFKNSAILTGSIMAFQVVLTCLMGYALSKLYSPKWSRVIFLICIGTMMIPAEVSLIPNYLILNHFPFPLKQIPKIPFIGIPFPTHSFINSYWGVILPAMFSPFFVLLFKGFFDTIPDELINAARIDGASEMSIFRRIILPISKPVFAVVCYFSFSGTWNSFMWPLIILRKNELMPLSVILYKFQYFITHQQLSIEDPASRKLVESGIGMNGLMAMSVIESIPVFIMFIIFREQLMTGIRIRGFK